MKNLPANAGDSRATGSIPGSGRFPGEGNGNALQKSCLENSMAEEPGGLQSMGLQRIGHDWACTCTHTHAHTHTHIPHSVEPRQELSRGCISCYTQVESCDNSD